MGFLKQMKNIKEIQQEKEEIVSKIKNWNTRCTEFFEWFEKEEDAFQRLILEGKKRKQMRI